MGRLSCNPAIGGLAKSQLVKEDRCSWWNNGASSRFKRDTVQNTKQNKRKSGLGTRAQVDKKLPKI